MILNDLKEVISSVDYTAEDWREQSERKWDWFYEKYNINPFLEPDVIDISFISSMDTIEGWASFTESYLERLGAALSISASHFRDLASALSNAAAEIRPDSSRKA